MLKEATITLRGKTTTIKYIVVGVDKIDHAIVTWENGERTTFYKGLYGVKNRWETKDMPADLIDLLSEIFEKETPVQMDVDIYG
ncbi:hypothetical protein C4F49_02330 [Sphingobacterium sp. KB22]|uniref:Uncharacterized protein n=1 Tax=Sphingobacterium hungaricum TaxID=2082723 RepID=A0A928UXD2_9SPHI|nr:hypothetical protein [Sphingobacterium hungaricum]